MGSASTLIFFSCDKTSYPIDVLTFSTISLVKACHCFSFLTDLVLTIALKFSKASHGNDNSLAIDTLSGRRDKQLA
ncbi:hypothetical protein EL09_10205 [Salmonella enterica subsp. enterica]|nr:hypothetical protein [Salmonella enterica]EBA5557132.1 hypothetical protein [Salmonella enterica]EBQ2137695.1 hypothetical protein [Salmonella enterica]EDT2961977.1 hypothetical protein [Salmonella enterica subsp. enterica]MIF50121.1 hypothetical protein [Salmonella enterica subsp. enterica]